MRVMRGRALQPARLPTGVPRSQQFLAKCPPQACPLLSSGESSGVAQGRLGMLTTEAPGGDGKTGKCFYRETQGCEGGALSLEVGWEEFMQRN